MKFNITCDDATFYVNKKKGVVVCVIDNTQDLFKQFALENFRISYTCDTVYNLTHNINSCLSEKMNMPEKFTGIARLSKDDEWNEEIGRAIAFSRAKDALLKSFLKRINTYVDTLVKWLNESLDMANKLREKLVVNSQRRHSYIDQFIGVEPEDE